MCGAGLASLADVVQRMAAALNESGQSQFSPVRFGQLRGVPLTAEVEQVAS